MGFEDFRHRVIDGYIAGAFEKWGGLVARNPLKVVVVSLLVMIACMCGMLTMVEETRSTYLWVPTESAGFKNFRVVEDTFGERGANLLLYARATDPDRSIFEYEVLDQLMKAHLWTTEHCKVFIDGKEHRWNEVCKKAPGDEDCLSGNFLAIWGYDRDTLKDRKGDILNDLTALHQMATIEAFTGKPEFKNDKVKGGKAVVITYETRTPDGIPYAFERRWNDGIATSVDTSILTISHFSDRSFDDEVQRLTTDDTPLFALGIIVITIYLALTLGPLKSLYRSRVLLGLFAVVNVLLALFAGFGLAALTGMPFVSLAALIPLILLGTQVDSVIIVVDYLNHQPAGTVEWRLSQSLRHSGPAILITSATAVCAFAVGTTTDLPSVTMFCTYAAFAFFCAFFVLFSFFLALLVLDERRLEARRISWLPCAPASLLGGPSAAGSSTRTSASAAAPPPSAAPDGAAAKPANGAASKSVTLQVREEKVRADAAAKPPMPQPQPSFGPEMVGFTQRMIRDYYAPVLMRPAVAVGVVLLFALISSLAAIALPSIRLGQPDSDVLPDDSYVQQALLAENNDFGGRYNQADIVVYDEDFNKSSTRFELHQALKHAQGIEWMLLVDSTWMGAYEYYLSKKGHDWTRDDFTYTYEIDAFLRKDGFTQWREYLSCSPPNGKICKNPNPTRYVATYNKGLGVSIDALSRRDELEGSLRRDGLQNCFAHSQDFMFAELDGRIWELTLTNMGYALIAVFLLTLLFTPPIIAVWITICVALIDLDLLGMMVPLDVSLAAVSFVNLVMAIGLSVDYCVHISHTFADVYSRRERERAEASDEEPVDPRECAIEALSTMGASVLKGGFTTFLGVLVIAFSSSVAFRTFFKMLSMTVVFGMLHGVVLMPVLLAYASGYNRYCPVAVRKRPAAT